MANNSPTIVAASLSDDQLKKSIDSLVTHVDEAMKKMVQSTNKAVGDMEAKLKSLGNLKIDSGGSADGGASKRAKAQNAETDAVEKNVAARDKQIKNNQEVAMSFDQMTAAQQKAASGGRMGIMETYNMQIELFKNRLREVRQDIDIFNAAIGSGKKTQIEWGQQGLKQANAEAEKLMRIITTLENQRGNLSNILAPQGHTLQNYVNSLQKANPELAKLNDQFKRGQSLLQQQKSEFEQNAQAQRNSTNETKESLDALNHAVSQEIRKEQERRDAVRQTGLAARETADQLIKSAHEQTLAQGNLPITGTKELYAALEQMRRAYFDMSDYEKKSPIGLALEADIKRANDAITVIRKYNQSLLGLQQNDANKITNASTLNSLRESLKNLTAQYNRLTVAELNAGKGDALIQHFQDTTRAAQILQRTLNRPVSLKAALSGDERTLDDIAYKMQRLLAYKQGIDLTKPNAANEIKQVDEALERLQKDADKWMSKSQDLIKNNTALGRSWNYMKNRLAFYFTVGAGTSFIKNLIEVRSQYEMNERALGILINSAERGTQIFNELSQMALVSPYTLIELSSAAKQLTAYDVAAKDVVDTTRRLADMAAAVGIPIERLTYALGQIKAYGYLNSRDARMFANAGIPLVKQLSDYYTELEGRLVSTADVYDRIKKKAIDYNEVMEVINKMTDQGGKFFDFQAKMADTLKVRLANLTLAWNNMLNDMGKESQGVLTWGIGALRDLFLHWKEFNSALYSAAWAGGITVAIRALNVLLVNAGFQWRILSKEMTAAGIAGSGVANKLSLVRKSLVGLISTPLVWWSLLAFAAVEATQAIFGTNEAQKALNESIRNGAKDNYDNISKFLEQYREIRESLYKDSLADGIHRVRNMRGEYMTVNKNNQLLDNSTKQDIDQNEAKKAWEAIREQIELTVVSSDKYIGNLLSISNMSERVRQGFNLLDDVQVVNAALKEIDDDTIKVSKDLSAWWNAWQAPDGLIGNLKDYQEALNDIIDEYGTLESFREKTFLGGKGSEDIGNYEEALERFRDDLQETTDSILNFIELKGWSGNESKINQVFEQITQKLALDNQLDPQKAFTLQTEMEEARSKAAKEALLQRINDEKEAYKISHDEQIRQSINADVARYKSWNETNGRSKVEWERFTKWLKEQHISETTAMFRNMDAEDIKSLNFQEGKHAEWVTRMVTQYAKEHKMSYDEAFKYLRSWVRSANQWSIFIPLTISTEDKKSVYDQLGEYDKAVDEADAQITRLTTRINELNAKKKKSKEETQELANAEQELADAQKAKADAEAKGGHGKKKKKDKKEADKSAKQAETELQKALKDELSTIDKVRSIYKDLTKEGMSHANAVERATRGWNETVNAINKVLQKNGLQKLDLTKFAGVANPREIVNMLQSQLDILVKRGAKPAEIKELQTKIQTLNVDAEKYDLTMITKGLNNELGKLKDEYELAVELDANPEMGNMFAEMFGIDTSGLPKSIDEYMYRVQQEFESVRKKLNLSESINIFTANSEQWYKWGEAVGYSKEQVDDFKKSFDGSVAVAKKWEQDIVKQTQDLQYKLADNNGKIAIEEEKLANLRVRLANEVNEEQKRLLELQIQDQQNTIDKLKENILEMLPTYQRAFGQVAEHSAWMTRRLMQDYKTMLENAQKRGKNSNGNYEITDPISGEIVEITENKLGKEIKNADKELRNTQSTIKKITEAFTKGKDGVVDWVHGVELISEELGKMGQLVDVIGNIADAFSNPNEYNATAEAIHDIATSMQGVSTAAKGIGQIANGDYIGGAASVLSGVVSVIGAWADNSDKQISAEIKESELAVKRLELTYKNLEVAIENAYGANVIGAKQAAIANKKLQLAELKRQLALEKARDSKHRDEARIVELQGQIIDLQNDIKRSAQEIATELLGISSVGDAALSFMDAYISALRKGEDAQAAFTGSWKEMIANMIKQLWVTKVIAPQLERLVDDLNERLTGRSVAEAKAYQDAVNELTNRQNMSDNEIREKFIQDELDRWMREEWDKNPITLFLKRQELMDSITQEQIDAYRREAEDKVKETKMNLDKATTPTVEDMRLVAQAGEDLIPLIQASDDAINAMLDEFGLNDYSNNLSSLQQGLQGMSESTASAVEAYLNGISQQCYLQSDLLTQIRDTVQSFDIDVQTGTLSEMLLQLQQSYQVQMSIQNILQGVLTPSGQGFRVELLS